jgi:hypothetical protein
MSSRHIEILIPIVLDKQSPDGNGVGGGDARRSHTEQRAHPLRLRVAQLQRRTAKCRVPAFRDCSPDKVLTMSFQALDILWSSAGYDSERMRSL